MTAASLPQATSGSTADRDFLTPGGFHPTPDNLPGAKDFRRIQPRFVQPIRKRLLTTGLMMPGREPIAHRQIGPFPPGLGTASVQRIRGNDRQAALQPLPDARNRSQPALNW